MKKIILFILFILYVTNAYTQEKNKKIYFLADTLNTSKNNQILSIKTISFFEYSFIFYCKCAAPYKSYISFFYLLPKTKPKSIVAVNKPNYPYISFKELMDIVSKYPENFNYSYDLYITEVLPNQKYRTNKVNYIIYPNPTQNTTVLKNK